MGSPLAKHVPMVLTALLVRQVVHILQLLVLLEPMPVVQHRVIHVVLGNTMIKKANQVVHHVVLENTTIISKDKLLNLRANHAVLAHTTINKDKEVANHVERANTMINQDNLVAKTIAVLVHTLNPIKPHV